MYSFHEYVTYVRYMWRIRFDKSITDYMESLRILNSEETVKKILLENLSISRYGDGEFAVMAGGSNGFQKIDDRLANRLREVITVPIDGHLTCIPYVLKDWSHCRFKSKLFSAGFNYCHLLEWVKPYVQQEYTYGDNLFTRFYMMRKDKSKCTEYVKLLKKIWDNQDLLFVEGKYSRLGVGNDLFDNAKSIKRILCPNFNAFDKYDEIFSAAVKHSQGRMVILALGMTATVMAYDLHKAGIRALDLGHIDIEYEWMLMGAKEKCPIPHKQMSEVIGGKCTEESMDNEYLKQIICEIA